MWFERPYYIREHQVNPYYWWWHDFVCRPEPYTYQWRRHVKRWWGVDLAFSAVLFGVFLWILLFPPVAIPFWGRITILVVSVLGMTFIGWLLLHLGGFASLILNKLFRRRP